MQLTPPYLEDDFPEDDEVPGIDDCDHLFSASNSNGECSVYLRVQSCADPHRGFVAAITVDCPHFVEGLSASEGPHTTVADAFFSHLVHIRTWFQTNECRLYWCDESRRMLRNKKYGRHD